ncbi:MAG: hypothetical protein ACC662_09850 [Planctomycetota bacterium]
MEAGRKRPVVALPLDPAAVAAPGPDPVEAAILAEIRARAPAMLARLPFMFKPPGWAGAAKGWKRTSPGVRGRYTAPGQSALGPGVGLDGEKDATTVCARPGTLITSDSIPYALRDLLDAWKAVADGNVPDPFAFEQALEAARAGWGPHERRLRRGVGMPAAP